MYGKRKSGVIFLPTEYGSKTAFWKFHSAGTYVLQSPHSNVQVSIFVMCLNFPSTGSQILLRPVSSSHRHRRTGRCGVLAIATWAAWFWAAQGRLGLLTKEKEEKKREKREKEEERKKTKEKKRKKEKRRKGRRLETDMGRLFRV